MSTRASQTSAKRKPKAQQSKRSTPSPSTDPSWEMVNRVVFPVQDQDLIMPLYAIEWTRPRLTDAVQDPRVDMQRIDFNALNKSSFHHLINEGLNTHSNTSSADIFTVNSRRSLTVREGKHVSLCTFFNAFPASYWKRWTKVSAVRFTATVQGVGELIVVRSTGRGLFSPAATIAVNSPDEPTQVSAELDMHGLIDGGYFWFDAKADQHHDLIISDAGWSVPRADKTTQNPDEQTTLSIAITTFNRPSYCHRQLKTIAAEQSVRERLDTIYVTDQGTDLVKNQPGFDETAAELGKQLTYIRQANFGGSGGFSRGMYETLKAGTSTYTLLLDDDAISEPEAIVRAVQFADYCSNPTIVGGGMLHLDNRTVLYTEGERFDRKSVWTKPSGGLPYNHDFAAFPLRDSPKLHQRIDSDFNGWWMCLIPTVIMKEIGLSLPVFIKFDDTEYALRALEHGYHTVCLPGVAVWHQAWHDKDPARTWEEYFFQRNRWICGLLHCPKPSPRFAYEMLYGDVNVGLKFVYSALKLRHMGLRDIMRGPEYIAASMPGKMAEVRAARAGFADTEDKPSLSDFPEPKAEFVADATPQDPRTIKKEGLRAIVQALTSRGNGTRDVRPDIAIPAKDAIWRSFKGVNSALVTSPNGSSVAWCRRDSALFRKEIKLGLRMSKTLMKRWEQLSAQYRAYNLGGIDVWQKIFESDAAKPQD
ncbi:glycosyltransferase [Bifidobacterium magnum]